MKTDELEQKLSRQPLRQVPPEWRGEILSAAHEARASRHPLPVTLHSWLSTLNSQLSALLWPHPKAWATLAAIWVFIFALNFSMREKTPVVAEKSTPPSPEMVAELRQQKLLFAELIGSTEAHVADRQKSFLPRPRSEYVEILSA